MSNSLLPIPSSAACGSPAAHPGWLPGAKWVGMAGRAPRGVAGMLSPSLPGQELAKATVASRRSRATKLKAAAPLQLGDGLI